VLRPKLMNISVIIGKNIAFLMLVNVLKFIQNPIGLAFYCTLKNILHCEGVDILSDLLF